MARLSSPATGRSTGCASSACDDLDRRDVDPNGLRGREGAFVACSFWMVGVRVLRGEHDATRGLLDRQLRRTNDLGLYAEEIDPATDLFMATSRRA